MLTATSKTPETAKTETVWIAKHRNFDIVRQIKFSLLEISDLTTEVQDVLLGVLFLVKIANR
jgi:hypothetical protein